MKKSKLSLLMCGLVLIGLSTTACGSETSKDIEEPQQTSAEKSKSAAASKSIKEKNRILVKNQKLKLGTFSNGTYTNKDGKITIEQVQNYHVINSWGGEDNLMILTAKFTNKSDKSVSPLDFFRDHFIVYGVSDTQEKSLDPSDIYDPISTQSKIQQDNARPNVLPGKTVKFEIGVEFDEDLTMPTKYLFEAMSDAVIDSRDEKRGSKTYTSAPTINVDLREDDEDEDY